MFPLTVVSKIAWVFVDERGQDLSSEKHDFALQHSILNCFMVRNDPIVNALRMHEARVRHGSGEVRIPITTFPCCIKFLPYSEVALK
jgi:hypothetical protein